MADSDYRRAWNASRPGRGVGGGRPRTEAKHPLGIPPGVYPGHTRRPAHTQRTRHAGETRYPSPSPALCPPTPVPYPLARGAYPPVPEAHYHPGTTAHLPSAGLSPPVDTPRRAVESHHSPSAAREPGGIPKGWPSGVANLFTSVFPAVRSRRDGQLSGNSRPRGLAVHRRVSSERGATRPRRRRRTMRPKRRLCGVRPCDA
jgi:hypothetical protein